MRRQADRYGDADGHLWARGKAAYVLHGFGRPSARSIPDAGCDWWNGPDRRSGDGCDQ